MTTNKTHVAFLAPSRFIQAGDVAAKDVTLTIARFDREPLQNDKGKDQIKGILYFDKTEKGLVMCKTNIKCVEALFGEWLDDWIGKRITLYSAMVKFGTKDVPGVRVRGSPDIPGDITFELKLPKKKAASMTLRKTGKPAVTEAQPITDEDTPI